MTQTRKPSVAVIGAGLESDTILENVDTVTVYSGNIAVTTRNRLPVPVTYTVTLNGFFQGTGTGW